MADRNHQQRLPWPAIWVFIGCGLVGVILLFLSQNGAMLLCCLLLLGWMSGVLFQISRSLREPRDVPREFSQLFQLARDPELKEVHAQLLDHCVDISKQPDPIFRELAIPKLQTVVHQVEALSQASIEYVSTESWRVAYEELLRSPGLHLYRSIAHIETAHYWQDGPGQQSTRLNLELQESRLISIERTAIIADHLWPQDSPFPVDPLHKWLDEQHRYGIWIRLVRESDVVDEPELLTDCGIYGSRAVGTQYSDVAGRTTRFVLSFDFAKVKAAEAIWSRLAVYAISYRDLLDQQR